MKITACRICPRRCGVLRGEGGEGICKRGGDARIARAALHYWEEPPISGEKGSGAVFFTGCPMGCVYCQNYEISAGDNYGKAVSPEELNGIFFSLVKQGAQNINLVSPTHFAPAVKRALSIGRPPVPVVYNTSGYERTETLKSLKGLVDIYLPDFKYAQGKLAADLSAAPDYPQVVRKAIGEMIAQVGLPQYDREGRMTKGVMIRHLILPGHTKNSIEVLNIINSEFPGVPVSLMAQYTPCGLAATEQGVPGYPELSRGITKRELEKVSSVLYELELEGFVQSKKAAGKEFIPDFTQFS